MQAANDSLIDQVVDSRYRVERCIGRGGMGVVWRAQHVRTGQRFALKTLNNVGSRDHKALKRVLHEARATAAAQSRHVVRVVDVQPEYVHDGAALPFIVMELLDGMSFAEWLGIVHRVELPQMIWVVEQIARGLAVVHRTGIVHRDLKPSNVFLARNEDGETVVKLCDFGIAKLQQNILLDVTETGMMSTETDAVFGTPRYMAPEQLRRKAQQGPATDQWALALIAFRALTGTNYFDHAHGVAELVLAIVHEPLPVPSAVSSEWPQVLDSWFMRSCSREPNERFVDVDAQLAALISALGDAESHSIRVPPSTTNLRRERSPSEADLASTRNQRIDSRAIARILLSRRIAPAYYTGIILALAASVFGVRWVAGQLTQTSRTTAVALRAPPFELPLAVRTRSLIRSATPSLFSVATSTVSVSAGVVVSSTARSHRAITRPSTPMSKLLPSVELLPRGAACIRSSQCADGLCAAEVCQ